MYKLLVPMLALVGASCAPQEPPAMTAKQESDFAKLIEGRTPGKPQSCVNSTLLRGNKTYGEGVVVFEGATNSVVWVNRPPAGCPELKWSRALRTRLHSSQLCSNDIATVFDPTNGIEYGSCSLGDFVPYRK